MKLYRIAYTHRVTQQDLQVWAGTQVEAKAAEKRLVAEHDRHNVEHWVEVEVPTSKPELLAWLNAHASVEAYPKHLSEDSNEPAS